MEKSIVFVFFKAKSHSYSLGQNKVYVPVMMHDGHFEFHLKLCIGFAYIILSIFKYKSIKKHKK